MNFDLQFHVAELLVIATAAWRVVMAANRITNMLKDYPPHRHENGLVSYPKGYEPPLTQRLNGYEQAAGK